MGVSKLSPGIPPNCQRQEGRPTLAELSRESRPRETAETSQALRAHRRYREMTDQADHLTAGRRRRHKSPTSVPPVHDLPLPRLSDHMCAEDRPPCSKEEEDAKRQKSASTTPRSTVGTLPLIGSWELPQWIPMNG